MIPGTFLYVYIGFFANGVVDPTSSLLETILKFVVGPIVTIVSVVVVTIVARRELKKQLEKDAKEKAERESSSSSTQQEIVNDDVHNSSNNVPTMTADDSGIPSTVRPTFDSKHATM